MVSKERYKRTKELFLVAAKLPKEEQLNYLKQACAEDVTLMEEVQALLLVEDKQITKSLEKLVNLQPVLENHQLSRGLLINERYQIESELGRGGFSVVYLAKDLQLNSRPVVAKVMLGIVDRNNQNWQEAKFFAEIKALSRINHPNVVAIYDYGLVGDNKPFFVMELILGETLRQILTKTRIGLPSDQALRIIKQIANALSVVHQLGIYHRDLKPENIMIRQLTENEEHVEVIDFGIATVKESATSPTLTDSVAGTLTHMAPEQFEGKPSASSDIYALGVIAYEMLTGRLPFNIDKSVSLKESITQLKNMQRQSLIANPSRFNLQLSSEVDKVFLKVFSYEVKERYTQPQEFVKALSDALEIKGKQDIYWKKLFSLAQPTNHSWFINEEMRKQVKTKGSCNLYQNLANAYPLNTKLSLILTLPNIGYLLLIVKDSDKEDPICLCPSRYAASDELNIYPVLLPTEGLIYSSLPLSDTKGRKQVIAIISKMSLGLSWPMATLASPAQSITSTNMHTLITKLENTPADSWSIFYSYVDII